MGATNKYYLEGNDMYSTYGFIPNTTCHETFLQPREPKDISYNDWPEENGREYDLNAPIKFKDRTFKMTGYIQGTSLANAKSKVDAIVTVYSSIGAKSLQCIATGTTLGTLLNKIEINNKNPYNFQGKTYLQITIQLLEVQ